MIREWLYMLNRIRWRVLFAQALDSRMMEGL
jgi:hypothetical protein